MRRAYARPPKGSKSRSYVRALEEAEKTRCGCCRRAVEVDAIGVTWHCSCRRQDKCELCGRCAIHCAGHSIRATPRAEDPYYVAWTSGRRTAGLPIVLNGAAKCIRQDLNNGKAHRPHRGKCPKWAGGAS